MTTLFLIRHGLTAQTGVSLYGRTPGIGLDERGRSQALHLAARFDPVRLTAIYSSPLERCLETVRPLAERQRLPVIDRPGVMEMETGGWTGKRLTQLRRLKVWKDVIGSPSTFRFPGGESFPEALERVVRDVDAIARRHPRGRVAVGTHGDIVRLLMTHFLGASLDRFQRAVIDPASVSVVTITKGRTAVLLVNDTGGLERFAPGGGTPPWELPGPGARRSPAGGNLRG